MAGREVFGHSRDGVAVHRARIEGGGLCANVIERGAAIQDLRLEGHDAPLVLGFQSIAHYEDHSRFFGAIVGRYANRIRDGRCLVDGRPVQLDRNDDGRHHLHGGREGVSERIWRFVDQAADSVTLTISEPHGHMGYPGAIDITCRYWLTDRATLRVELSARAGKATPCNLAHHSYFNLDDGGATPVLDHRLRIDADRYVPVDRDCIPRGRPEAVAGTAFDFRRPRPIRHELDGRQVAYDENWCLADERRPLARAARLEAARSGLAMEIWTTEPGLQFFAGQGLGPPVPGFDGIAYGAWSGLCLEPQMWPDSPNHPAFPQAILRPGETYRQVSEYRFAS